MGGIKSPPLSTPQRSGGDRHGHPGGRRDEIDAAAPLRFQTPPPRDQNDSPGSMVSADRGNEAKTEWPVDDGTPLVARHLPCHPREEEEKKQAVASQAGSDRRQGGEERDSDRKRSGGTGGGNSPEAAGGATGFAAADAVEPAEGRQLRLNSQQTDKLSAAAAAIEAAAAAVAAIPVVGSSSALFS